MKDFTKKAGWPVWDKSKIISSNNSGNGRGSNDDSSTLVYIPFVIDTTSTVNAVLAVNMEAVDTSWQILYANNYKAFGFDTTTTSSNNWNARDVFQFFALFDHDIFGYTKFRLKDTMLFNSRKNSIITLKSVDGVPVNGRTNRVASYIDVCTQWEICDPPPGGGGDPIAPGGGGSTVRINSCYYTMNCVTYYYFDWSSGGGGGSGSGSGGGGSSGWWSSPTCTNTATGTPVACPLGWTPADEYLDYENRGYLHLKTLDMSSEDLVKIQNWKANNIDTTGLHPCVKQVLEKLINGNNVIGRLLQKMERSVFQNGNMENFYVKFTTDPMGADSIGWNLNPSYDNATKIFSVRINYNALYVDTTTELGLAYTLMHEILHAYLTSLHYRYFYSLSPSYITSLNYESLFNSYMDSLLARNTRAGINAYMALDPQIQHNFMVTHFQDIFADILQVIDDDRISNKHYYWFLTWGGLWKTKAGKMHWPNYADTVNRWPPLNPSPSEDSTRGLKYALTLQRIDSIRNAVNNEDFGRPGALGRRQIPGACF